MTLAGVSMGASGGVTGINMADDIGVAMLKKSLDSDTEAAQGAVQMIQQAPAPSLDPNVGTRFDASV